jgi:aspartate-semialdehyde dehydrogenase
MVAVNRVEITVAPTPFGAKKRSGLGRDGRGLGIEAISDSKNLSRGAG